MFRVSKDSPVYYLTSVTHNRLPVFRTAKLKDLLCGALDEARRSAKLLLLAYVVMPDHLHALIGSNRKPSEVTRFVNSITGRRIIDSLKDPRYETSLKKLRHTKGERDYQYSLWDHHPNLKLIATENGLIEKANCIHLNPVRGGLVERPEDYRWSSVRYWMGKPLDDEPLKMDLDQLAWRRK